MGLVNFNIEHSFGISNDEFNLDFNCMFFDKKPINTHKITSYKKSKKRKGSNDKKGTGRLF